MSAAIPPPATFVVSGNLVIQILAGALFLVAGALVAVIVYVFRGLAKEVERLADRIEVLPDSLGKRIDSVADLLGKRIDSVADLLGRRIDSLDKRIDNVAGSLSSRIDNLTDRMDKLTDRMDKLTERIDRLGDTLHAEIASVRQDVYLRLEQTREHAS
ncbi:MAG: hypothetical protein JOZ29_07115 [Deltaproteobacteria bacterium]|nr:hypothetical protein [Deltaproteobacteria bacterium]